MQALFPLGDVDLLDAYHLCGGRVVTFRASGASRSPASREATAGGDTYRGRGYRCTERGGISVDGVSVDSYGDNNDGPNVHDGGGADRAGGREMCKREEEVGNTTRDIYSSRSLRGPAFGGWGEIAPSWSGTHSTNEPAEVSHTIRVQ